MAKKISFPIQKGGVGKTTILGNISYLLSLSGAKVLMIDLDLQGNLSSWFLENVKNEIADYLVGNVSSLDLILANVENNLDILPSKSGSFKLRSFSNTMLNRKPYTFMDLFEELEKKYNYDYIFVDLAPSFSELEEKVLWGIDEVIIPLTPEHFSVEGIKIFNTFLLDINSNLKRLNKNIKCNKIILNLINMAFKVHKEFSDQIKSNENYKIFFIPQDRNIANLQNNRKTIFSSKDSKIKSRDNFYNIAKAILEE